ncbi:MAG TPA: hypothetical protein ENI12_06895 [Nitrospirae bacterium]|nr:hypothetical protein [Nitrospirota bacterium]
MLPHKHFAIAGLAIAPVALLVSPLKTLSEILEWVIAGGLISALLDLDLVALVNIKSRNVEALRPFRRPRTIFRQFGKFMGVVTETGVLRTAMKTHWLIAIIIATAFYFGHSPLFIPVLIGLLSHLATDLPNIRRAMNHPAVS